MITLKSQAFFEEKLSGTIGKPKKLWKSLKSVGMRNKTVMSNFNASKGSSDLTYDTGWIPKILNNFLSNLEESLLIKLSKPPDK